MNEGLGEQSKGAELQFDKGDFVVPDALRVCSRCQTKLEHEYFDADGSFICPACAGDVSGKQGGALWRAFAFGAGAALVGTIIWFLIIKFTEREFGLIAIAVGFFVGFAVRRGSRGRGGWRFQALAIALTYVSITASYIPLVVKGFSESAQVDAKASNAEKEPNAPISAGGVLLALALVFAVALASPFLGGFENIMGLIIIGIALYEAWKLNKRAVVSGPFQIRAGPVVATS